VIAYPVGVVFAWAGLLLLIKALRARFGKEARKTKTARRKSQGARGEKA